MRKFFLLCALAAFISSVALSTCRADETKKTKAVQSAQDPNFRFHNGQWWYWMPQQQNWKVWNGSEWNHYQPGQSFRARSYSYADDGSSEDNAADWQLFGRPLSNVPANVSSNNQIIGSFGIRGAGSKVLGNY